MKTENEYAEILIEQYYLVQTNDGYYCMSKYMAIQCAINDVHNTIEAFNSLDSWTKLHIESELNYYNNVLNILKEKV
jgi:hypothetical protein